MSDGRLGRFLVGLAVVAGVAAVTVFVSAFIWTEIVDRGTLPDADTCVHVADPGRVVNVLPGNDPLDDPDVALPPNTTAGDVCASIDSQLGRDLFGDPDGFVTVRAGQPSLDNPTIRLAWSSDGCSFRPVASGGPFGFLHPCERHDFAWRNPKRLDRNQIDAWNGLTKTRADLGFLYDMRVVCAGHDILAQPFCEVTARTFYLFVDLNASDLPVLENIIPTP